MRFLPTVLSIVFLGCSHTAQTSVSNGRAARMEFKPQKVSVDAYWKEKPVVDKDLTLRLEVRSESGDLVPPPGDLSVSVWMKTHSYGLVEPTVLPVMNPKGEPQIGVYDVTNILFMASGQWEVRVYMKVGGEDKVMQKFIADLGEEKQNPMSDPKSPIHQMMNKAGMDHSKHMNHDKPSEPKKP
ncbi:MAG: hypothetical protein V4655_14485 [Bdellovibrionota bacterium]